MTVYNSTCVFFRQELAVLGFRRYLHSKICKYLTPCSSQYFQAEIWLTQTINPSNLTIFGIFTLSLSDVVMHPPNLREFYTLASFSTTTPPASSLSPLYKPFMWHTLWTVTAALFTFWTCVKGELMAISISVKLSQPFPCSWWFMRLWKVQFTPDLELLICLRLVSVFDTFFHGI